MDPLFMLDEEESAQVLQQEPPATREPSSEGADDDAADARQSSTRGQDASARMLASSVPISIPSQFKRRAGEHAAEPAEPLTFVPPHQLSHRDPHAILADGSIPLSSSSKLRNRNIVLRSTGFLPAHCTEGFLISRAHAGGSTAGASGHIGAAPSLSERRSDRRKSQQLTAAVLEPLQRLLSEQSASGALSVQASLPERGAGGSPAPQPVPSAQ